MRRGLPAEVDAYQGLAGAGARVVLAGALASLAAHALGQGLPARFATGAGAARWLAELACASAAALAASALFAGVAFGALPPDLRRRLLRRA